MYDDLEDMMNESKLEIERKENELGDAQNATSDAQHRGEELQRLIDEQKVDAEKCDEAQQERLQGYQYQLEEQQKAVTECKAKEEQIENQIRKAEVVSREAEAQQAMVTKGLAKVQELKDSLGVPEYWDPRYDADVLEVDAESENEEHL
jgi:septal ring factor EnvC (AmiA/AmiB activator)